MARTRAQDFEEKQHALLDYAAKVLATMGVDKASMSQIAAQAQTHGIAEQEVIDRIMLEPMPKKKFITIEEVAATIEFLASPAARNITGQTIVIDGGWTAR